MIGRSGERGSGISVLAARHDDDDDNRYIYYHFFLFFYSYILFPKIMYQQLSIFLLVDGGKDLYKLYRSWNIVVSKGNSF